MRSSTVGSGGVEKPAPVLALLAALLAPTLVVSQAVPVGPELEVNTYTTDSQQSAAVAADAQGRFVVVWQSEGSLDTDTDSWSVQGQLFASDGSRLGGEFQLNTYTTGAQFDPVITFGAGGFVVVWSSVGSSGTDTDQGSIQAQRFDADGNPVAGQFQVNTYTTGAQRSPALARGAADGFVVAWSSQGSDGTDSDGLSVRARRFDADGTPLADDFQVNTYTTLDQTFPAVAADPQGNFLVTWDSEGSGGTDTSYQSIQARIFDAAGVARGDDFQVNTFTTAYQRWPAACADADGRFVVAWQSLPADGDPIGYSVQAQRFDGVGTPLGGQFQVNTLTMNYQAGPAVASDADGGFVVAWRSDESAGSDTSTSVQARRFAADGTPLGPELQVNSTTVGLQWMPAVAARPDGSFVVAWDNGVEYFPPPPVWLYDVRAQLILGAFFYDGFETGDLSRWSSEVP